MVDMDLVEIKVASSSFSFFASSTINKGETAPGRYVALTASTLGEETGETFGMTNGSETSVDKVKNFGIVCICEL